MKNKDKRQYKPKLWKSSMITHIRKDFERQKLGREFDNAKHKLTVKYYDDCNKLWKNYQAKVRRKDTRDVFVKINAHAIRKPRKKSK